MDTTCEGWKQRKRKRQRPGLLSFSYLAELKFLASTQTSTLSKAMFDLQVKGKHKISPGLLGAAIPKELVYLPWLNSVLGCFQTKQLILYMIFVILTSNGHVLKLASVFPSQRVQMNYSMGPPRWSEFFWHDRCIHVLLLHIYIFIYLPTIFTK